jgi:NUMOD1 domain
MVISRALNLHGHGEFILFVLEYCSKEIVLEREQYYLDVLNPEYNILKTASNAKQIKVLNIITNEGQIFDSIRQAARELKINRKTIVKYLNKNIAYQNFLFEVISPLHRVPAHRNKMGYRSKIVLPSSGELVVQGLRHRFFVAHNAGSNPV